jgi:hypothetical protein
MKPNLFHVGVCLLCAVFLSGCLSRQTVSVNTNPSKKYGSAQFSRGNGESYDSAVVITGGRDYTEAVACEDIFISNSWGAKDKDWRLVEKTTVTENKRTYDMVQVEIPKVGEKHFYYFDITHYKKKPKPRDDEEAAVPSKPQAPPAKQEQKPVEPAPQQTQPPSQTKEIQQAPQTQEATATPLAPAPAPQATPPAKDTLKSPEKK